MNDKQQENGDMDAIPQGETVHSKAWQVSLIWLVPLVTIVIAVAMMVNAWQSQGATITITFDDAQGIVAGKTEVKYKSVVIGKVTDVNLASGHDEVEITVELEKNASDFATEDSRFWVVRPRVGLSGVSGLNTILSGPYITADTGDGTKEAHHFTGLDNPPPVTHGEKGSNFKLTTDTLGSIDIDTPVYYRHIQVGRVVGYDLSDDGSDVTIHVFVNAPYDGYVMENTRFWNTSGIDVSLDASGVTLNTESIISIMAGGIAFELPPYGDAGERAETDASFMLFSGKDMAMKPEDGDPIAIHMRFRQSIRGLSRGAIVDFLGVELGEVKAVSLDYDVESKSFPGDVIALIYPKRMGQAYARYVQWKGREDPHRMFETLIKSGLRAQLRSGNLLTGKLYVALDFFPNEDEVIVSADEHPLKIPTMPGSFDRLQEQIVDIVDKLHDMPLDEMTGRINQSLTHLENLLQQVDGSLAPNLDRTLDKLQDTLNTLNMTVDVDSPLQSRLQQTLDEVERSARAVRNLSDTLSRNPQSLLRGYSDKENRK